MRDASGRPLKSRSSILKARKRVKCKRHFQVRPGHGPRGDEIQLTCCVCDTITQESLSLMNTKKVQRQGGVKNIKPASQFSVKHYLSYWKDERDRPHRLSGGVRGICKTCTKIERDKLYPLPKAEEGR